MKMIRGRLKEDSSGFRGDSGRLIANQPTTKKRVKSIEIINQSQSTHIFVQIR